MSGGLMRTSNIGKPVLEDLFHGEIQELLSFCNKNNL